MLLPTGCVIEDLKMTRVRSGYAFYIFASNELAICPAYFWPVDA